MQNIPTPLDLHIIEIAKFSSMRLSRNTYLKERNRNKAEILQISLSYMAFVCVYQTILPYYIFLPANIM